MADPVASLPEPISEDTEDITKNLGAAKAYWSRGKHAEALASVRRAAEAAMAAGQHFRSTELSMSVSEIEDAIADAKQRNAAEKAEKAAQARAPAGVPSKLADAQAPKPAAGRGPMLDPWSEENAASLAAGDTPEPRREISARKNSNPPADKDVVVVEMRARPAPAPAQREDEDEGVMTSAAPLHEMLKRKAQPPPPPSARAAPPQPPPPALPKAPPLPTPAAAPAEPAQTEETTPTRPSFADLSLASVTGLRGLPPETRELLTEVARIEELTPGKRIPVTGAALLISGQAGVCAGESQIAAQYVERGTLVPGRGTLGLATTLSLVGGPSGATVAVWNDAVLDAALKASSWIHEELSNAANHFQAIAGATLGPMGEISESVRQNIVERMSVRVVQPQEIIAEQGQKLLFLFVVGAGALELVKGEPARVTGEVSAGDFLFPGIVVRELAAPTTVRGGVHGAVVLVGDQNLARSILTGPSPAIGILNG